MSVPDWVQDAIFYQIFPDRFRNGDPGNDPPVALPWNACATPKGFHGGDLVGVTQGLDYLLDLGTNAIYLNPIFLAASNHRYDTMDYYRIDPKLGTLDDFHALIREAHRRGIRVILDGVFNHCGRGFFAFADVLENAVANVADIKLVVAEPAAQAVCSIPPFKNIISSKPQKNVTGALSQNMIIKKCT